MLQCRKFLSSKYLVWEHRCSTVPIKSSVVALRFFKCQVTNQFRIPIRLSSYCNQFYSAIHSLFFRFCSVPSALEETLGIGICIGIGIGIGNSEWSAVRRMRLLHNDDEWSMNQNRSAAALGICVRVESLLEVKWSIVSMPTCPPARPPAFRSSAYFPISLFSFVMSYNGASLPIRFLDAAFEKLPLFHMKTIRIVQPYIHNCCVRVSVPGEYEFWNWSSTKILYQTELMY